MMIRAEELRVGNLVILNVSYKDNIYRVDEIYTDEVKVTSIEDGGCFPVMKLRTCKPIPLTPEWLEWCGFGQIETIQHNQYEVEERYIIRINETNISYGFVTEKYGGVLEKHTRFKFSDEIIYVHKEVLYVHQLQNLYFALTGEELNVKL